MQGSKELLPPQQPQGGGSWEWQTTTVASDGLKVPRSPALPFGADAFRLSELRSAHLSVAHTLCVNWNKDLSHCLEMDL